MKTDDLISMLATGPNLEETGPARDRLNQAVAVGALGSMVLMIMLVPVNPALGQVMQLPPFWQKLGFAGAIAIVSLLMVSRLSRPGRSLGKSLAALAAPIMTMWMLAAFTLLNAEPEARTSLFFGNTWKVCPFLITMLAAPVFATTLWAMRDLAPTRLRFAGAAAGLLAGAVGAFVYCFHCPELDAPFIAFWYLLGMLIPAAIGALVGPRVLRW